MLFQGRFDSDPALASIMRWLLIALLVSVAALLIAAAALARHIRLHHARTHSNPDLSPVRTPGSAKGNDVEK